MVSAGHLHNDINQNLVDRPRLLTKLNQATHHRLTLISAPPGYGKTALVNQFVSQAGLPTVWHTIDLSQRDAPILHNHARRALEKIAPGISAQPTSYGHPAYELAAHITQYLTEHLKSDVIYILDDVHLLDDYPMAQTWLRTLIAQLPAQCHVIIMSRTLPDIPLTEMIARREILALGQEELRFRREEIAALAVRLREPPPTENELEDLEIRLEGWPAGTLLALQPLPAELARLMLRGGTGPEALFNSLAQSMLESQPAPLRDFLLDTATLERITPELCSEALGLSDSLNLFQQALSRNMFLSRVTGGLAYHALFREFLQNHLRQTNPQRFRRLHKQVARWLEKHDQPIAAFNHFLAADELQQAAHLANHVSSTFFTQGKHETILQWASILQPVWQTVPDLLCTSAKIHYSRYQYQEGDHYLQVAESCYQHEQVTSGLAEVNILRGMMHLQRGRYAEALQHAQQALLYPEISGHLIGRALAIIGTAQVHLGDITIGLDHLQQALPHYEADGDIYALSSMMMNLEFAYRRAGQQTEAAACLQRIVALRRQLGNAGPLALALNNLGYHYHQHSGYQQALATFQEGLSVIARVPIQRTESYLYWSLADLQRDRGAFSEAHQLYYRALELIRDSEPALRAAILVNIALLHRWQNNTQQALNYATEAVALSDHHMLETTRLQAQALIIILRSDNQPDKTLRKISPILDELRRRDLQFELMQVLGWCATEAFTKDRHETAHKYLSEALMLAQQLDSAQLLAAEAYHGRRIAEILIDDPIHAQLYHDLNTLRRAQYRPLGPQAADNILTDTYALYVHTFGTEFVERNGVQLTPADWRAAARELFLFILFHKTVTKEQINLAFWPDSDKDKVRNLFHTTLYRVRQALGDNVIVFEDQRYRINPLIEITCDAEEFEIAATQARLLPVRDPRTEDLWHKAVSLYEGYFLLSVDAEWANIRRDNFQELYIEALIGLGKCARTRGDSRAALQTYKRALDIEPYREDINREIMICYADLGEKHQIILQLDRLRQLLRTELALEPSAETIELANRLLA